MGTRVWWLVVMIACGGGGESTPPCVGPDCPCGVTEARCDGVCIDIANDPRNCGDCGHDCLGARCSDGACLAETVAILPGAPVTMAMQDDELLVATSGEITTNGRLYRLPKAGGANALIYRELGVVPTVAVDGDQVVVGDSSLLFDCEVANTTGGLLSIGPDDNVTVLSRGRRCSHSLRAAEEGLFWLEQNRVELLATNESAPTSLFDGTFLTRLELLDADTLLVIESGASSSTLKSVPRTGGPATSVLMLDGRALAVREGRLAFEQGNDLVVHTLATGTEVRIPTQGGNSITDVTLDASFVYWLSSGTLFVGDPVEGTKRVLARVDGISLLQDEAFVYVLSSDVTAARISRIRKPANARPSSGFATCEPPLQRCFDDCTDVTSDPSNCGDCGRECEAGEFCAAGECVCAPDFVCGGACVDLMVNAQHCGACDQPCPGNCVGGACAPVALTVDGPNPIDVFAQDDAAIYFARGGLKRLDKETHVVSSLTTMELTGSIAVDTSVLYVTESGLSSNIHAVSKTGSTSSVVYPNRPDARQIGLMGDTLVWTEDEDFGDDTRKVVRAAKDGSGILSSVTAVGVVPAADEAFSIGYAIDGETVYWLFDTRDGGGAVARVDFSTTPPTTSQVTLLDLQPTSIALRGDDLLVSMEENGNADNAVIVAIPKVGGSPRFVANASAPTALEVSSDGRVAWLDHGGNFVRELDPVLELPLTVASSTQHASVVLFGDGGFYVATGVGILFVPR